MVDPQLIRLRWRRGCESVLAIPPAARRMHPQRPQTLLAFCQRARHWLEQAGHVEGQLLVQLMDEDPGLPCLRFDAPAEEDGLGPMIPDPYALATGGFQAIHNSFFVALLPPWRQRLPVAIWRGSSTGTAHLNERNQAFNRRLQLCRLSQKHPGLLDARLTALVQVAPASENALRQQLLGEELVAPRLSPWQLALHRWLIEIDGNVNSWGLLWKLLSGSCVLKVESPRRQWYHRRLQPWVHVVPVDNDLGNLPERLAWCQTHPEACAAIALQARNLALEVVAALEQDQQRAVLQWADQWMQPVSGIQPIG